MIKLSKFILYDIIQNKIILVYTILLFVVSMGLFQVEANNNKALMGLLSVILLVVPLICLIFTTIHYYNSYEFMELLLAQPQSRPSVLWSEFAGVSLSLLTAFFIGAGIPVLIYSADSIGISLLATGAALSVIFCALAFFVAVHFRDKAIGIGIALLLWFYFALIYDGLLLLVLFSFSDYPIEKFAVVFSALNPIDLGRVLVMLKMDIGALMGYTGAVYKNFLGNETGILLIVFVNICWIMIPFYLATRKFNRKDL